MTQEEFDSGMTKISTAEFVRNLAREEVLIAIEKHLIHENGVMAVTNLALAELQKAVQSLESRLGRLVAFMAGAGFFGTLGGSVIAKYIFGG